VTARFGNVTDRFGATWPGVSVERDRWFRQTWPRFWWCCV